VPVVLGSADMSWPFKFGYNRWKPDNHTHVNSVLDQTLKPQLKFNNIIRNSSNSQGITNPEELGLF